MSERSTTLRVLDAAARLLDAAGRTAADSQVAIDCLRAAECVERAGGRISPTSIVGDVTSNVRSALALLSALEDDALDGVDVQAAMALALRALRSVR
jgi:hypothetical protein